MTVLRVGVIHSFILFFSKKMVNWLLNSMSMRFVTYNVLSVRRACRLRGMSHEIDAHIIGLAGTRPFQRPVGRFSAQICCCSAWATFRDKDVGYEQTRCSNMAAGVSILVSKKLWKPEHVVRVFDAPGRKMSLRW